MSKIAGIDLGTTFSSISVLNELGHPQIVPNMDGERITPSVVYFPIDGQAPMVGTPAKNLRGSEPGRVFSQFKRAMDKPYDLYKSGYGEAADTLETFRGEIITPTLLSSLILKKLVDDASHHEGEEIEDVVISVPAYFKETQRDATVRAGENIGLNVLALVNEPTAAAIQYGRQGNPNGNIMIFDLGGGTFDVSIVSTSGGDLQILTSQGDARLGGCDFDQALAEYCEARFAEQASGELFDKDFTREQLEADCENLKKGLSKVTTRSLQLSGPGGRTKVEVSRDEFSNLIDRWLSKIELIVESALHEIEVSAGDISETVLVGGSTRVPAVHDLVERIMGKPPIVAPNVDEIVALGATIRAGLEAKDTAPEKLTPAARVQLDSFTMTDVANAAFGTFILDDQGLFNDVLIAKNTPLPHEVSKTYYTVADDQAALHCQVTQGSSRNCDDVDIIHDGELALPTGRRAGQPVTITYSYDASQTMHCRFRDEKAGKDYNVDLHPDTAKNGADDLFDDLLID